MTSLLRALLFSIFLESTHEERLCLMLAAVCYANPQSVIGTDATGIVLPLIVAVLWSQLVAPFPSHRVLAAVPYGLYTFKRCPIFKVM